MSVRDDYPEMWAMAHAHHSYGPMHDELGRAIEEIERLRPVAERLERLLYMIPSTGETTAFRWRRGRLQYTRFDPYWQDVPFDATVEPCSNSSSSSPPSRTSRTGEDVLSASADLPLDAVAKRFYRATVTQYPNGELKFGLLEADEPSGPWTEVPTT